MRARSYSSAVLLVALTSACARTDASAVYQRVTGDLSSWAHAHADGVAWLESGGGGSGGSNGSRHHSYHRSLQAELPAAARAAFVAALLDEVERAVAAAGGATIGRGSSGAPMAGFRLSYRASGAVGHIAVDTVAGEGGRYHVFANCFEAR